MFRPHAPRLAAVALLLGLAAAAHADTVRISGASTVMNVVVGPAKSAVEKATGHTLQITASNTGKGLADLLSGATDLAMVSEPMDIAAEAAAASGASIDLKKVAFTEVRKDEIVFVVHPSNPVGKLSWEQLRDIHTGKIANWKEVGGADKPIVVYADSATGGTRAMIKKIVFGGTDFGPATKTQMNVQRAAAMVAGDEAGIAGVGRSFVEAGKGKVVDTKKLERPLGFATAGAPTPAQKAVIDAFAKEARAL